MIEQNQNRMHVDRLRLMHMTTVPTTLSFLESQIQYAKSKGVDVHVVSSSGNALKEFESRFEVEAHELPMERRITPFRDLMALWKLARIIRKIRPQIVHGHTPKGGLLAMLGAWWCGVPVRMYHIHGLPMVTATGMKRRLLRWAEKISCLLASQVYCVSKSVREVAVEERLCRAEKIEVLLHGTINGVDAVTSFNPDRMEASARTDVREMYHIPADALVIGFVGRVVRDKGINELSQAWNLLKKEFPSAHLLIIGPFEPQDPVPQEVQQQLQNDDRIHLAGWVGPEHIPKHLCALDVLALPTYREGFNTVLLEASAMRLPVVASRVPGCTDGVLDGETGMLVPSHDAQALADALSVYLRDAGLRSRHGTVGRERVLRDFRPEDMSRAIYLEYVRHLGLRTSFYRRYGKRAFDFIVSATALLLLSPLLVVLIVLVRCLLGGPVFFRQTRTGVHKRPFSILKFRTMTNACDANGNLLSDSLRLTKFGRFLRGTSLDELPELWNVVVGEMSLVGPRPLLPLYDSSYTERENRRFEMLPGITGWAQINGRNELAWDDRLECDVHYIENCTIGLDFKILLLTVKKVLRRENVQVDPDQTVGCLFEERKFRSANQAESLSAPPN
jgi:lipopolysaccharide/colanic/teichoic acid biosynthesis glycosyltransferase